MGYWLRAYEGAPEDGPYTADELRAMAARGEITSEAMISPDRARWFAAHKVKGLFADAAAPADAPPPAPAAADIYDVEGEPAGAGGRGSAPPLVAPPVIYGGARRYEGPPGEQRDLRWFIVVAAAATVMGLIAEALDVGQTIEMFRLAGLQSPPSERQGFEDIITPAVTVGCGALTIVIGLWIYWLVWVYQVHADVQRFTGGRHDISPGLALGLCFVPLFNLFWGVYMPYKLARTMKPEADRRGHRMGLDAILALLIVAIFASCMVTGSGWLLRAIAFVKIQNALNAVWREREIEMLRAGP